MSGFFLVVAAVDVPVFVYMGMVDKFDLAHYRSRPSLGGVEQSRERERHRVDDLSDGGALRETNHNNYINYHNGACVEKRAEVQNGFSSTENQTPAHKQGKNPQKPKKNLQ